MGKLIRSRRFIGIISILLFGWAGPAITGAPAPIPASSGPHPEHLIANLGEFQFENGEVVKDFKVSYVTHGKLNRKKDNVILAMHPFTWDHHGHDHLTGKGKALDPEKYFIVATDFLGNSNVRPNVTTGPTNSGLRMEFPRYTTHDMVNAEYKLLKEYLGFDQILAAIGISVGAIKAYQLAVSHPTFSRAIIPIAGTPVTNPRTKALLRNNMAIIALDSGWHGGNYYTSTFTGVTTALLNLNSFFYTDSWFASNLKTREEYRDWENFWYSLWTTAPQDARDIYYGWDAWADHNVGNTPGFNGDVETALRSIKAKMLLVTAKEDLLFPRADLGIATDNIPNATVLEIDSFSGHLMCCGFDPEATAIMDREIAKFLEGLQ